MDQYKNILFVVDGAINHASLERAARLAQDNNGSLTVIETVEKPPTWTGTEALQKSWDKTFQTYLATRNERFGEALDEMGLSFPVTTKVVEGSLARAVINEVEMQGHDLVIKNAASSEVLLSRLLASNNMRLLRRCPCPILLTRNYDTTAAQRVLAAVDFENPGHLDKAAANESLNRHILETAISLAHRSKGRLDVVHVYPMFGTGPTYAGAESLSEQETRTYVDEKQAGYETLMRNLLADAKSWFGNSVFDAVEIHSHCVWGNPKTKIPEESRRLNSDILVMGTVARTGVSGFFIGNTAEAILDLVDCSVFAVKPEGFINSSRPAI